MNSWPTQVWHSTWLAGLDSDAHKILEEAGEVLNLEQDQTLFALGETADAFFVIAEGIVEVMAVRRGRATPQAVRRAASGDAVGEDAIFRRGAARVAAARAATRARVVRVPASVYRRVSERYGRTAVTSAQERPWLEGAARDVLIASSLAPALDQGRLATLLGVARHRQLTRGEVLFAQGDARSEAFIVADGMVSLETEESGRLRIIAYLQQGDLIAGEASSHVHAVTARACGTVWVVSFPREAGDAIQRARPQQWEEANRLREVGAPSNTRHVGQDLWRYAVAGSLLVIDDEACVRCGHCASRCADAHEDGVSRLVRRGPKLLVHDASSGESRALLVPGSCQHCKHPACMIDCPTGAIGRSRHGEVLIREDICVGCGQCERSCPWGAIQMAPRVDDPTARIAVKCDLCSSRDEGPACIEGCPLSAIARIEPDVTLADVRAALAMPQPRVAREGSGAVPAPNRSTTRASLPRARAAWPWVLGAVFPSLAVAGSASRAAPASASLGALAGVLMLALVGYSVAKRTRLRSLPWMPGARAQAIAHLSLGVLTLGVVAAHAGGRAPPNAAGAALVAFALASLTGIVAAVLYATLPRILARIEPQARLAEDLPQRAKELDERTFGVLSGRSDASKVLYARVLAPYAGAWLGGLLLIASGRTLRGEQARLKARLDAITSGRLALEDTLTDLVALVVERRAIRGQGLVQATLRACVPAHVLSVAAALVLTAAHVVSVLGVR